MIKRTLCFSNPAVLSFRNGQLVIKIPGMDKTDLPQSHKDLATTTIPVEDIGIVVLDHPQITITQGVFAALLDNNAAVVTCNGSHLPTGMLLPLDGNTTQSERFKNQIDASLPLKKQLWQQTIEQKIHNQATVLQQLTGAEVGNMRVWESSVKSGDSENLEARAAAYYWSQMYGNDWTRGREGQWPNALLNYGYAILRAVVARALVASGLLPTFGIHHHNRYNAYCLADDIMEPYRPYVDEMVWEMYHQRHDAVEIDIEMKRTLLTLPVKEVVIGGQRSPLMVAVAQTTASLNKCFNGEIRKIAYPSIDAKH